MYVCMCVRVWLRITFSGSLPARPLNSPRMASRLTSDFLTPIPRELVLVLVAVVAAAAAPPPLVLAAAAAPSPLVLATAAAPPPLVLATAAVS